MIKVAAAMTAAAILAGIGTFTFFGGYWYELLRCKEDDE